MMISLINKNLKCLPNRINNKEGAVLIISMFVLMVLLGLTACFSMASVAGLNAGNTYVDSAEAFWAAEAAINRFIQDTSMLDDGNLVLDISGVSVNLSKDDSDPQLRVVTATAFENGIDRSVSVEFPANSPDIYNNTISSGGNIEIDGFLAGMGITGQTRISGTYSRTNGSVGIGFEFLDENVDSSETTLGYSDVDGNGTADEFNDFVEYNRRLTDTTDPNYLGTYTDDEVIYYPTNGTLEIDPDVDLAGVKVIFVEGAAPGQGNVEIVFNTAWEENLNVTIVATGEVTFLQPLGDAAANSMLNTLSWGDYNEGSVWFAAHGGVSYTKGMANFGSIASLSRTTGALIAEQGMDVFLLFVGKLYDYYNPIDSDGLVPPAFQGLAGGSASGYSSTPSTWAEIEVASQ